MGSGFGGDNFILLWQKHYLSLVGFFLFHSHIIICYRLNSNSKGISMCLIMKHMNSTIPIVYFLSKSNIISHAILPWGPHFSGEIFISSRDSTSADISRLNPLCWSRMLQQFQSKKRWQSNKVKQCLDKTLTEWSIVFFPFLESVFTSSNKTLCLNHHYLLFLIYHVNLAIHIYIDNAIGGILSGPGPKVAMLPWPLLYRYQF